MAAASSSIADSTAKVLIDMPTERQYPTGMVVSWRMYSTSVGPVA